MVTAKQQFFSHEMLDRNPLAEWPAPFRYDVYSAVADLSMEGYSVSIVIDPNYSYPIISVSYKDKHLNAFIKDGATFNIDSRLPLNCENIKVEHFFPYTKHFFIIAVNELIPVSLDEKDLAIKDNKAKREEYDFIRFIPEFDDGHEIVPVVKLTYIPQKDMRLLDPLHGHVYVYTRYKIYSWVEQLIRRGYNAAIILNPDCSHPCLNISYKNRLASFIIKDNRFYFNSDASHECPFAMDKGEVLCNAPYYPCHIDDLLSNFNFIPKDEVESAVAAASKRLNAMYADIEKAGGFKSMFHDRLLKYMDYKKSLRKRKGQ